MRNKLKKPPKSIILYWIRIMFTYNPFVFCSLLRNVWVIVHICKKKNKNRGWNDDDDDIMMRWCGQMSSFSDAHKYTSNCGFCLSDLFPNPYFRSLLFLPWRTLNKIKNLCAKSNARAEHFTNYGCNWFFILIIILVSMSHNLLSRKIFPSLSVFLLWFGWSEGKNLFLEIQQQATNSPVSVVILHTQCSIVPRHHHHHLKSNPSIQVENSVCSQF